MSKIDQIKLDVFHDADAAYREASYLYRLGPHCRCTPSDASWTSLEQDLDAARERRQRAAISLGWASE